MDPKKQDLNPELKQIYERVMNTQVSKTETPPLNSPTPVTTSQAATSPATPPTSPAPTAQTTQNTPFLSTAAPKPVSDNKTFVFTGNKIVTPQGQSHTATNTNTQVKKSISGPIIGVLVVILVVVWGIFWAKIFGLF